MGNTKEMHNKLRKAAGLDLEFKWIELGSGSYGTAFDAGNGKVVKMTRDEKEAEACAKLKSIGGIKNVYKVYDVYKFKGTSYFAIVQEKLNEPLEILKKIADEVGRFSRNYHSQKLVFSWQGLDSMAKALEQIKDNVKEERLTWYEEKILLFCFTACDLEKLGYSICSIFKESKSSSLVTNNMINKGINEIEKVIGLFKDGGLKSLKHLDSICAALTKLFKAGIRFSDLHSGNIMQNKNGEPIIIDLGLSRVEGAGGQINIIEKYIRNIINGK